MKTLIKMPKPHLPRTELITGAPSQDRLEYIKFLKYENTVIYEDEDWLVIEHFQLHTPEHPHYVIFPQKYVSDFCDLNINELVSLSALLYSYRDWYKYESSKEKHVTYRKNSTGEEVRNIVNRFHLHVIRD